MKQLKNITKIAALAIAAVPSLLSLNSCTEQVDDSARYTFKQYTVASYLQEHDDYSEYIKLLGEVNVSGRSESTVLQRISARGNFTVFAPTNKAIANYLEELTEKGIISQPSWDAFPNEHVKDSIKKVIVYNSILDGGDQGTSYQTSGFPEHDGEEFLTPNMNDRMLTIVRSESLDSLFIDGVKNAETKEVTGGALVDLKNHDILAINGYIHQVHSVVAPSNETVGSIFEDMIKKGDDKFLVLAKMVHACGLIDTLSAVRDERYEAAYLNEEIVNLANHPSFGKPGYLPEHRKYGYTIFAETDKFWANALHKPVADITPEDVCAWVVDQGFYPNASGDDNYSDPKNALYQFVTYHILPMRIPVDKLVIHYTEKDYDYKNSTNYSVPVWETYTTMGQRRLLKIYQTGKGDNTNAIYLNRFPKINNGRTANYLENGCDHDKAGLVINTTDFKNVINGYIYPIDTEAALVYDENTRVNLSHERIRFDAASMFPEFMNNNIRYSRSSKNEDMCVGMPIDKQYKYLNDVEILEGTNFYYLSGYGLGWKNFQGDEFNVTGRYEMIFRLPPVPVEGIYEIRYAVQNNSGLRGMCQVYFGTNKKNLAIAGIPLDLRIGGASDLLGWQADIKEGLDKDELNAENDKQMRANGFMKAPKYYHVGIGITTDLARENQTTTRRIIVRDKMSPDQTYYLKFKSVLDSEKLEFYMDYLELVSKDVYDNEETPEDIW